MDEVGCGMSRSTAPVAVLCPRCLPGIAGNLAARDFIRVYDVNAIKPGRARQAGLAASIRAGNNEKGRIGRGRRTGQEGFRSGGRSTRSPCSVRAM